MTFEDSDTASAKNYSVTTDITVDGSGNVVKVDLTHTVSQEKIFGTDETFTYNFPPDPERFVKAVSTLRSRLVDSVVSDAVGSVTPATEEQVREYVTRELPRSSAAVARVFVSQLQSGLSTKVPTEGGEVPAEVSSSVGASVPHMLTIPVVEGVGPPSVESVFAEDRTLQPPRLSFTTRPVNEPGDIVPEFGATEVTTQVGVGVSEFVRFTQISAGPITPTIAVGQPSGLPVRLPSGKPLNVTLPISESNGIGGDVKVDVPGVGSQTVSVPAGGTAEPKLSIPTADRSPGEAVEVSVEAEWSGDVLARRSITIPPGDGPSAPSEGPQQPSPDPPAFRVGSELPSNPVANEGFPIALTIENVGGSEGEVRVSSPDSKKTFKISPGGSRTWRETGIVVDNPGRFTRKYTVENLATDESFTREVAGQVSKPPEEPSPRFEIADVIRPPAPTANKEFSVSLRVRNVGDAPGSVRVSSPDSEKTFEISPGGSRTWRETGIVVDNPGRFTRKYTVENLATGKSFTREVTGQASKPLPPAPSDLALTRFQPPQVARPGQTLDIPFTVKNVGEEPIPDLQVGVNNNFTPGVKLAPGDTFPSSVKVPLPTEKRSATFTLVAESGDTELLRRSQSIALRPEEPKPPEEPDPPSFRVGNIDLPPNPVANKDFSIGLLIENVGGSKGKVRVKSPDTTKTFTLSPGGSRTFREEQVVVNNPGRFTREYTVTNLATGESFTREVTGRASEPESVQAPRDEVIRLMGPWRIGNETFFSHLIAEVVSAKASNGSTTVRVNIINRPQRGGGFMPNMTVEVAVAGKVARETKLAVTGVGGGPDKTEFVVTVDAVAPTARVGYYPAFADGPGDVPVDPRFNTRPTTEVQVPVQPPSPPTFELETDSFPTAVGIGVEYTPEMVFKNTGEQSGEVKVVGPGLSASETVDPGGTATFTPTVVNREPQPRTLTYRVTNVSEGSSKTVTRTVGTQIPSFAVVGVDAPESAPLGEPFSVGVTVANVGSVAGEAKVSLPGKTETVTIQPGNEQTVSASGVTVDTLSGRQLSLSVTNTATDETISRSPFVSAEAPLFDFVSADVPDPAPFGEEVQVTVELANDGQAPGEYGVTFNNTTRAGSLQPGESTTLQFPLTVDFVRERTFTVAGENRTIGERIGTTSVTVTPGVAAFAVASVDVPDPAPFGKEVQVGVEVVNEGGGAGKYAVTFNNTTRSGSLQPGESTTLQFPLTVDFARERTFPLRVRSTLLDRQQDGQQVTVTPGTPQFEIAAVDAPPALAAGERGEVTVTVRNRGAGDGVAVVSVPSLNAQQEVRVPSGGEQSVRVSVPPLTEPVAQVNATVAWKVTGQQMDRASTRIEQREPELTIRRVDTPETAPAGTQYRVGVRVANDGDAPADVTVSVGRQQQRVSLSPGGKTTVGFQREQPPAGTQRLQVTARAEGFPTRSQRQVSIPIPEQEQPQQPQQPQEPAPEPSPPDREPPEQPAESPFEQVLDALFPWLE